MRAGRYSPKRIANFKCKQCDRETWDEYYVVHDKIWWEHGTGKGMLCVLCLESRLERKLTPKDFKSVPVNFYPIVRTAVLRSRMLVPQGWIDMRHGLHFMSYRNNQHLNKPTPKFIKIWCSFRFINVRSCRVPSIFRILGSNY